MKPIPAVVFSSMGRNMGQNISCESVTGKKVRKMEKAAESGCLRLRRLSKNDPVAYDGGKESVKGNRQGSLSRSMTRRSDQNCKIKLQQMILQFCSLSKSPIGLFDKLSGRGSVLFRFQCFLRAELQYFCPGIGIMEKI